MTTPETGVSTPRLSNRRRGQRRGAKPAADDTELVRALRAKYPSQLGMLSELFPDWSDEDLLMVIQESNGEVEVAVGRISDGHAKQFSSVKSKKQTRKEHAEAAQSAAAAAPPAAAPAPPVAPVSYTHLTLPTKRIV